MAVAEKGAGKEGREPGEESGARRMRVWGAFGFLSGGTHTEVRRAKKFEPKWVAEMKRGKVGEVSGVFSARIRENKLGGPMGRPKSRPAELCAFGDPP